MEQDLTAATSSNLLRGEAGMLELPHHGNVPACARGVSNRTQADSCGVIAGVARCYSPVDKPARVLSFSTCRRRHSLCNLRSCWTRRRGEMFQCIGFSAPIYPDKVTTTLPQGELRTELTKAAPRTRSQSPGRRQDTTGKASTRGPRSPSAIQICSEVAYEHSENRQTDRAEGHFVRH